MLKYYVGIYAVPSETGLDKTKIAYQSANLTSESDPYEVKDENGNVIDTEYRNPRVRISLDGIIKKGQAIPLAGSIIKFSHLDLPTVSADGRTVTGDLKINPSSNTEYEFIVDGSPSISQSNTDYPHCSLEAIRYLVNGVPDSEDSDSD